MRAQGTPGGTWDRIIDVLIEAAPWPRKITVHDLQMRMEQFMERTEEAIRAINTETDALAARIDELVTSTDEETAAALRPIADRLRSIAADPSDPVPPEEPTV